MANNFEYKNHLNIAIIDSNHFARQGIASLLNNIFSRLQIKASVSDYTQVGIILEATKIDVLLLSGTKRQITNFDRLKFKKISESITLIYLSAYTLLRQTHYCGGREL